MENLHLYAAVLISIMVCLFVWDLAGFDKYFKKLSGVEGVLYLQKICANI